MSVFFFLLMINLQCSFYSYMLYVHNCLISITRSAAMRRNQVFNDLTKYWRDRNKKWKMAYPYTKFCVKIKLLSGHLISIFSNS